MRFLMIASRAYAEREWLKANGFRFERPDWVKPSEDEGEYERVRTHARGRFELARKIDPASLPPPEHSAVVPPSIPDKPRREQFYVEGQVEHREPKPYARRIAEPLGSREDYKRDSARNWSRALKSKN